MMNFKKVTFKQRGQAMVEYAILLILMVTLIMGGLELSVTAYNSKKTGDAAEAGANAWAEAISFSKTSTASTLQNEDLQEQFRQALNIDTDENLAVRNASGLLITAADCDYIPKPDGAPCNPTFPDGVDDIERPELNTSCVITNTALSSISLPFDISLCSNTTNSIFTTNVRSFLIAKGYVSPNSSAHPLLDFEKICTSRIDEDIEKIIPCRDFVDQFDVDTNSDNIEDACTTPPISPATTCPNNIDDLDISFRVLFVNKVNDDGSVISPAIFNNRVALGDHDPKRIDTISNGVSNQFRRAGCNVVVEGVNLAYDNGLPQDGSIYLFNPLPIDITDCTGEDAARNNTSRASILVGGFTNNANAALNIEGLPALNQAMYSQYSRVCVNLAGDLSNPRITIVSCNNFTTNALNRIWLKPPGKMCGARFGGEVCPDPDNVEGDGDLVISNFKGATGFYYFGRTNDAVNSALTPTQIYNTFRPAFQIVCDGANMQNANTDAGGACLANGTGSFALEVHTRYRSIFESFLTFGFNRLANANLAQYFYNPNGVGTSGAVVGAAGSELGPVESIANPIPSLKKIKDFRGCYRVDISPPDKIGEQVKTAVSSCN